MIKKTSNTKDSSISKNNNRIQFNNADKELTSLSEKLKHALENRKDKIIIAKRYSQQTTGSIYLLTIMEMLENKKFDQAEIEKVVNTIRNSALLPQLLFVTALSHVDAIQKINYLLDVGIEINTQFDFAPRNTFMHMLLVNEKFAQAESVLKKLQASGKKIDLSRTDIEGKNVLITAVRVLAPSSLIKLLLEQGEHLNIDHTDQAGKTAVYYACLLGQTETLTLLQSYDADLQSAKEALDAPLESVTQTLMQIEIHPLRAHGYPRNQLEAIEIDGKEFLANKQLLNEKYKQSIDQLNNLVKKFWQDNFANLHTHPSLNDITVEDIKQNITYQTVNNFLKFIELGENKPKEAQEFYLGLSITEMKKVKLLLGCRSAIQRHIPVDASKLKDFYTLVKNTKMLGETSIYPKIPLNSKTILEKCVEGRKAIISDLAQHLERSENVLHVQFS